MRKLLILSSAMGGVVARCWLLLRVLRLDSLHDELAALTQAVPFVAVKYEAVRQGGKKQPKADHHCGESQQVRRAEQQSCDRSDSQNAGGDERGAQESLGQIFAPRHAHYVQRVEGLNAEPHDQHWHGCSERYAENAVLPRPVDAECEVGETFGQRPGGERLVTAAHIEKNVGCRLHE